jgi:FMNH2-dependent dimethyl sulfone monooxygenase
MCAWLRRNRHALDHSRAGVRGIALSFVNYLEELPYFRDKVLPQLAQMGLRQSF